MPRKVGNAKRTKAEAKKKGKLNKDSVEKVMAETSGHKFVQYRKDDK